MDFVHDCRYCLKFLCFSFDSFFRQCLYTGRHPVRMGWLRISRWGFHESGGRYTYPRLQQNTRNRWRSYAKRRLWELTGFSSCNDPSWSRQHSRNLVVASSQWAKSPKNSLKSAFVLIRKYSAILSKIHSYRLLLFLAILPSGLSHRNRIRDGDENLTGFLS